MVRLGCDSHIKAIPPHPPPIERLPPVLSIENTPHVLLTPQFSAIPASELGDAICTLHEHCPAIIGALDFLCTGYERHVLIPV